MAHMFDQDFVREVFGQVDNRFSAEWVVPYQRVQESLEQYYRHSKPRHGGSSCGGSLLDVSTPGCGDFAIVVCKVAERRQALLQGNHTG